jgi:predicted secreted protein
MTEPVCASVGETFEVSLEGIPTAGFVWEVDIPSEARRLIEALGSEWTLAASEVGAPASQRFRFLAMAPGELTLIFRYRRSWENTESDRRTVAVRISDLKHNEGG